MFTWVDESPGIYQWLVWLIVASGLFFFLRPLRRATWSNVPTSDWRWALFIVALLAAGRWPSFFVTRELNPDESQFVAGALTLRHDLIFWRSVDGATSGPLNFYALLPIGCLTGDDTYLTARLAALVLLSASLVFCHQALAITLGREVARVSSFGAACMEGLTQQWEFLHYSSELVSVVLLAFAFLALARSGTGGGPRWNALGGMALGAMPYAKLQALPIAVAFILGWTCAELLWRDNQNKERATRLLYILAGATVPTTLCAALLTITGQWEHAWISYILYNIVYASDSSLSLPHVVTKLLKYGWNDNALATYWIMASGFLTFALSLFAAIRQSAAAKHWRFLVIALTVTAAAGIAILTPHRAFPHYMQLCMAPLLVSTGAAIGLALQATVNLKQAILFSALLLCAGPLIYRFSATKNVFVGSLTLYQRYPRSALAAELTSLGGREDCIAVWGWLNRCYAEAGYRQATRDANTTCELKATRYQPYFRKRYIEDLLRNRPVIFVDSVAPGAMMIKDPASRHEVFPELAGYVQSEYTLVDAPEGVRIYLRNDRLAELLSAKTRSNR